MSIQSSVDVYSGMHGCSDAAPGRMAACGADRVGCGVAKLQRLHSDKLCGLSTTAAGMGSGLSARCE